MPLSCVGDSAPKAKVSKCFANKDFVNLCIPYRFFVKKLSKIEDSVEGSVFLFSKTKNEDSRKGYPYERVSIWIFQNLSNSAWSHFPTSKPFGNSIPL